MKIKILIYLIVGFTAFNAIWLFNMLSGLALIIGFGFGILLHGWFTGIFKNWQKGIYLTEKKEMQHRKIQLEAELKQLEKDKDA